MVYSGRPRRRQSPGNSAAQFDQPETSGDRDRGPDDDGDNRVVRRRSLRHVVASNAARCKSATDTSKYFLCRTSLLFMVVGSSSRKALVNSSTLQFFGYISYGLYLIHLLVFQIYDMVTRKFWPGLQPSVGHFDLILLRFVIVSSAAVGFAYISRRYYEEWFLRLKDRVASPLADLHTKTPENMPAESAVKVIVTAPAASATAREASESF